MGQRNNQQLLETLTNYWRRVQVAAALESIKDERDEHVIRSVFTHREFLAGTCPQSVVQRAFQKVDADQERQYQRVLKRNPAAKRQEAETHIDVVFSPFSVKVLAERNAFPINVLFGTAKVDRKGNFSPADVEAELPPVWVGRPCLAPSDGLEDDVFPLADADEYYDAVEAKLRNLETWPTTWDGVMKAVDEIWANSGSKVQPLYRQLLENHNYAVADGWIRFDEQDPKRLTIIKMYERLMNEVKLGKEPALYREAALAEHRRVFSSPNFALHLGQMGGEHPLAPSQRSSLLAYLQTPDGHVTAINGPPGTGKTTLLQSVVASEFVKRAALGAEPPLYVAAAATNQAVSNIIKAFREATEKLDHPLADRWIPGLGRRYGVYFRGSKGEGLTLARGSLVCVPSRLSNQTEYSDKRAEETIREIELLNTANGPEGPEEVPIELFLLIGETAHARKLFLSSAARHLGEGIATVDECATVLQKRIRVAVGNIETYEKAVDGLHAARVRAGITKAKTYDEGEGLLLAAVNSAAAARDAVRAHVDREKAEDDANERIVLAQEQKYLATFEEDLTRQENEVRSGEYASLAGIQKREASLASLRSRYAPFAEPTDMWGWIQDRFFPWVRVQKVAGLSELVMEIVSTDVEISPRLERLRKQALEVFTLGERACKNERRAIEEAQARRVTLRDKKQQEVAAQIGQRRAERRAVRASKEAQWAQDVSEAEHGHTQRVNAVREFRQAYTHFVSIAQRLLGERIPTSFDDLGGAIDTTLRVEAFLLATHYWEARFLATVRQSSWRDQISRATAFRTIAMLAPCFVSTFDKLGSSFNVMKQGGVIHPLWEFADTLVIDEAGQASPDKGAFAFAFAKKALVVGDTKQLPPVNSTDSAAVATSLAKKAGLLKNEWVADRGLLTGKVGVQQFSGSLMRMASSASYYDMSPTTQGMWLRDHFRCDPRIIAFCNEIWYTGETALHPRRIMKKTPPLSHFGHLNVIGQSKNKRNEEEAAAIVRWINEYGPMLEEHYGKDIEDIVAVLTPFSNQKTLLRSMRASFPWRNDLRGNPQRIVMGTVHALQGAERPLILFSTVYDKHKPQFFFDFEHTLLNVAVSRAQDSLVVVGNRRIFAGRPDPQKPSTVLQKYILDTDVAPIPAVPDGRR